MINTDIKVNRPESIDPLIETDYFAQDTDIQKTIQELCEGRHVLIEKVYSNGLKLLKGLQSYLKKRYPTYSFQDKRAFRSEYQKLSNLILIRVKDNKLDVKKAPFIGWLDKLYPENHDFLLPFPQIQGLNSAWQWNIKGVLIPGLRNRIHPYYGVYFPTRFEHILLFENWLKHYEGAKKTAIDVGIGSGVLSFLLMKYGFQKSFGTDINPNAIIGLNESMKGTKLSRKIEIDYGYLFGKWIKPTELIVFNPPWLPTSRDLDRLDDAIYYNDSLFPNFFEEAEKRLLPGGKIVLLFSNLAEITNVAKENPIEKELKSENRFELERCFTKSVKASSTKTKRDTPWRSAEKVELWVLRKKPATLSPWN